MEIITAPLPRRHCRRLSFASKFWLSYFVLFAAAGLCGLLHGYGVIG